MFDVTVNRLIQGHFICEVSEPSCYAFLKQEDPVGGKTNFEDVAQHLLRMNMRLSQTDSGTAFFVSFLSADEDGKKAAKAMFQTLKNDIRPLLDFFKLIMDVTGNDYAINPGQKLDLNRLAADISQNQNLVEALRKIAIQCKGIGGDTDRGRLDRVIKRLKQDGYVVDVNKEQDIYQLTGKVEYFHDILEFLMQHDEISEEDLAMNDKAAS